MQVNCWSPLSESTPQVWRRVQAQYIARKTIGIFQRKRPNHQLHSNGHGESSHQFDNNDDYGIQSSCKEQQ